MSEPITIEVAALLGDSVVDVKHCTEPRGGKLTHATLAWLAGAAAAFLIAASALAFAVSTAGANQRALAHWTRDLRRPEYAFRPTQLPITDDVLAFGGIALAIVALGVGLSRLGRERRSPFYRIGTAPGVELATSDAPATDFPLVAPSGDGFALTYTPAIDGVMVLGGATTPLAQLAGCPSAHVAGAVELPIPAGARIRATVGKTAFAIAAMAPPRPCATAAFAFERRVASYFAASLAAHVLVLLIVAQAPVPDSSASIELDSQEGISIAAQITAQDTVPPPPEQRADDAGASAAAGAVALDSSSGGAPTGTAPGALKIEDRHVDPAIARAEAIAAAREAGILGTISAGMFETLAGTENLTSGFDDSTIYGGSIGDGDGNGDGNGGTFGTGRAYGPGGGGVGWGTIAVGRYGTCGDEHCGGAPTGVGIGTLGGMRHHVANAPVAHIGAAEVVGDSGPIIRRYIRRNIDKISYCYEKELMGRPKLGGDVVAQFVIMEGGAVNGSSASGFDPTVSTCVADVIAHIEFPHIPGGATVRYPFTFRAPG